MSRPEHRHKHQPAQDRTINSIAWRGGVMIVAATVVYWPSLRGGYTWDDYSLIRDNAALNARDGLWKIWSRPGESAEYYPLTHASWWLERRLFGPSPVVHHTVNLLLHIANSLLLWHLLARLRVRGAWLAATLFAVHPLCVESVAWMCERKNLLAMLLSLLAAAAFQQWLDWRALAPPAERPGELSERRARPVVAAASPNPRHDHASAAWLVIAIICFAMALLAKTAVATVPLVFAVMWWYQRGQSSADTRAQMPQAKRSWRGAAIALGACMVLCIAASGMTIYLENVVRKFGPTVQRGLHERVLVAGAIPWFYLLKTLAPYPLLAVYHDWKVSLADWRWYAPLAAGAAVASVAWLLRQRIGRGPLTLLACYLLLLAPVLGLINIDYMRFTPVADHFAYMPVAVLLTAAGWALGGIFARHPGAARAICAVMLAVMCGLSWSRARLYGNVEQLWANTVLANPHAWIAWHNLAHHRMERGDVDGQRDALEQALRAHPDHPEVHLELGHWHYLRGDLDHAAPHYEKALADPREAARVHANLGVMLTQAQRHAEALSHFRQSVQAAPDDPDMIANLAILLATCPDASVRNAAEAAPLARKLCDGPQGRTPQNLGILATALVESGQREEALTIMLEAEAAASNAGDMQVLALLRQLRQRIR